MCFGDQDLFPIFSCLFTIFKFNSGFPNTSLLYQHGKNAHLHSFRVVPTLLANLDLGNPELFILSLKIYLDTH